MEEFRPRRPLLDLLRTPEHSPGQRSLFATDLNIKEAMELLNLFLTHFHIYNPVLDIVKIEEQIRCTALNGLDWDAQSCLLVC